MNSMNPIWLLAMLHVSLSNIGITIGSPSRFSSSVCLKYSSAILNENVRQTRLPRAQFECLTFRPIRRRTRTVAPGC